MLGMIRKAAAAMAIGVLMTGPAFALSDLGNPPPASVIVTHGGLEWVWANPCEGIPDTDCGVNGNLGVLLHDGFHFASAAEWGVWADLATFQAAFAGGQCASPQFSKSFDHCDLGDMMAGFIWGSPLAPDASHRDNTHAETFLVRAVPEPATLGLMAIGLGLMGFVARRRRA
jgi:hypothetical protein